MHATRQQEPKRNYIGIVADAPDEPRIVGSTASPGAGILDYVFTRLRAALTSGKRSS